MRKKGTGADVTKAERLIFLSNLIANHGPVSVADLASECEVSGRTIYRDIIALSNMNFPVYYDNGYRLAREAPLVAGSLTADDIDLICYALRNNPLSVVPYFKQKFSVIEQLLQAKAKRGNTKQGNLFQFEKRGAPSLSAAESGLYSRFIQAIFERRKVRIKFRGRGESETLSIPVGIKHRKDAVYLLRVVDLQAPIEEVPIKNIASLEISDERFAVRPVALRRNNGGNSTH